MQARVYVYTFKEGLFAKLAHDLRLSTTNFQIRLEAGEVRATFDASSLRVDGVMTRGKLDRSVLSDGDRAEIEATIRKELLESAQLPKIELSGRIKREGAGFILDGQLSLHGQSRGLRIPIRAEQGLTVVQTELVPSRFGIPQYKALMGAIALQDRIVVRVELLEELAKLEAKSSTAEATSFKPA